MDLLSAEESQGWDRGGVRTTNVNVGNLDILKHYGHLSTILEVSFFSLYRHNLPYVLQNLFPVTCNIPQDFPPVTY